MAENQHSAKDQKLRARDPVGKKRSSGKYEICLSCAGRPAVNQNREHRFEQETEWAGCSKNLQRAWHAAQLEKNKSIPEQMLESAKNRKQHRKENLYP
jgi:hypothetical protein